VHFRLSLIVKGLELIPSAGGAPRLQLQKAHALEVVLLPGSGGDSSHLDVLAEFETSTKISSAFTALDEERLPEKHLPRTEWPRELDFVDGNGAIAPGYMVPLWLMPEGMRAFVNGLRREMNEAAEEVLGVLRWRSATLGPARPFSSRGMQYSLDGATWKPIPADTSVRIGESSIVEIGEGAAERLQALLDAGAHEPAGHDLLREAWSQQWSNPRSSMLLGMAALEIGVKSFIAECLPEAEWLALHAPSPPVHALLVEYLPTLKTPAGRSFEVPDEKTAKAIKVAVGQRNELAHRGAGVPFGRLENTLITVRKLLFEFDVALGQEWAAGYVLDLAENRTPDGFRRI
jgi:hypothetical protein